MNNTKNHLFVVLTINNLDILPNTALESHSVTTAETKNIKIILVANLSFCVNCTKEGHPSRSRDFTTFLSEKIIIQNETSAV